jgi:hypothetical protein
MINQNEVNCHLIGKVVFCGGLSSSMEIRKFCVHDKDYQQFVTLVSDSLHQQCVDKTDDFQMMYLDSENDWVTFSSDHEWNEAKQLYRRSSESSSRVMMKVKVMVQDDDNLKQHCSINLRGKKRRTGSSSKQSSHATSSTTRPDKQHLTVGYSFEEFRKQMEAMSQNASAPSTAVVSEESKKRKHKKRPSSSTRKTSRKARKTHESEVPSIISSCSSSDESITSSDEDSSVVEAC